MRELLCGRRPVLEALRAGRTVRRLLLSSTADAGPLRDLLDLARERGVAITRVPARQLDEAARGENHQGVVAYAEETAPLTLKDVLNLAKTRGQAPFVVLLDGIEDPQNLGAVVRTADAAGAHAVVVPEREAAGPGPGVHKASAGASSWLPVVRVTSLAQAVETLKRAEVFVVGADAKAEKPLWRANLKGAVAIAIGSEHAGLSRLVRERCDELVRVPMHGRIESLNASVAAGLLLYEKVRQESGA